MSRCALCRGLGWVLDGNPDLDPAILELLPCNFPNCTASGRELVLMSIDPSAGLDKVSLQPQTGLVMSVWRQP